MVLHEVYFAGLGGEARTPNTRLGSRIKRDFGSFECWRTEFAAMGKALGGGSGWVLLTWSPRAQRLINSWAADHTMTAAGADILLALDMYEHAYAIDYGSAAGPYVDAFMSALRWDTADRAFAALSHDRNEHPLEAPSPQSANGVVDRKLPLPLLRTLRPAIAEYSHDAPKPKADAFDDFDARCAVTPPIQG